MPVDSNGVAIARGDTCFVSSGSVKHPQKEDTYSCGVVIDLQPPVTGNGISADQIKLRFVSKDGTVFDAWVKGSQVVDWRSFGGTSKTVV